MKMEEMILVSTDDHVIEPPGTFTSHVPAKYLDRAPRIITLPNGEERWRFVDRNIATVGGSAVVGRAKDELHIEPTKYSGMRKGCYDIHARMDDMNVNGVLTSLCFPTLPGFGGELFIKHPDKALMIVLLKAYNDWHLQEWAAAYPGRMIPISLIPLWDIGAAVEEIARVAKLGSKGICFPENTTKFGLPSIHTDHWNPVWEAIIRHDLVMLTHIGTGGGFRFPSLDSPMDICGATMNITLADFMADLLYSPVLRQYPELKVAVSEGYLGWVQFFKERCDYVYDVHSSWSNQDFGNLKPSDIIRRNFMLCFTEDPIGLKNRHEIGIEVMTWECDYPHADSTWPVSPERLWKSGMKDLPEAEVHQITHENAMRWFNFNPFQSIKKADASVGALRALAKNVDLTPIKGGSRRPAVGERRVLTVRDFVELQKQFDLAPTWEQEKA
jgi:predicted TIM-barrel fold metal-dependent hydrolase